MDRLRAGLLRDLDDSGARQIAFARCRRAEPSGLVARGDVHRIGIASE
jgi:hypothetical protein